MALAVRAVSSSPTGADPVVVSKPSGTLDGDLLWTFLYLEDTSTTVDSVPSGWTILPNGFQVNSAGFRTYCYYKRAASEGASWSFGITATPPFICWGCVAISGNVGTGVFLGSSAATNESTANATTSCTAITTTAVDSMILAGGGVFEFTADHTSGGSVATAEQIDIDGIVVYSGLKATMGDTATQTLTRGVTSADTAYTIEVLLTSTVPDMTTKPAVAGYFTPQLVSEGWF